MSVNATEASSISKNWVVSPPYSKINVSGNVEASKKDEWRKPSQISFNIVSTNTTYVARVTNGRYSIALPNWEYYRVSITTGNPSTGTCTPFPNTLEVIVFQGLPTSISSDWAC